MDTSSLIGKGGRWRTTLEYSAARLLFSGLALVPRPLAICAARAMAWGAYLASRKLRRVGEFNLQMAFPKMSRRERRRLLRESMVNLGRHMVEFSRFSTATPESLREIVNCEGLEHLAAAQALGRGVIMVTGHLGAWEIINFVLSAFGQSGDFLVRRIENPAIERSTIKQLMPE